MVLPPSFSRKMGEIETVEAEKMGWIYLPCGTFYPTFPYICIYITNISKKYKTIPVQPLKPGSSIYYAGSSKSQSAPAGVSLLLALS